MLLFFISPCFPRFECLTCSPFDWTDMWDRKILHQVCSWTSSLAFHESLGRPSLWCTWVVMLRHATPFDSNLEMELGGGVKIPGVYSDHKQSHIGSICKQISQKMSKSEESFEDNLQLQCPQVPRVILNYLLARQPWLAIFANWFLYVTYKFNGATGGRFQDPFPECIGLVAEIFRRGLPGTAFVTIFKTQFGI